MQVTEMKIGPHDVSSMWAGIRKCCSFLVGMLWIIIVLEVIMVVSGYFKADPKSWVESLTHPANISLVLLLLGIIPIVSVVRGRALAFAWLRLDETGVTYLFRKKNQFDRIKQSVPYSRLSGAILSRDEEGAIYYRRHDSGVFGLESLIGIGKKSEQQIRTLEGVLKSKAPHIKIFRSASERLNAR